MATNNSSNQQWSNEADGFKLAGGATKRELTLSAGDVAIEGGSGFELEITDNASIEGVNTGDQDLSGKQDVITGGASSIVSSDLTTNRALVSDGSGKVAVSGVTSTELNVLDGITASTTELNYTDGVTSAIQTQLDNKYAPANILGSVSESGGVPTGAVIESGSNAYGSYTKWADGTMICVATKSESAAMTTSHGSSYRTSSEVAVTLPVTFVNASTTAIAKVSASQGTGSALGTWFSRERFSSNSEVSFFPYHVASTTVTLEYRVLVVGRWF